MSLTVAMSSNTGGAANSSRRWSYSKHERVVGVNHGPFYHPAKEVLNDFREQFIADVDTNTLVMELSSTIPHSAQEKISRTDEPEQKNTILHDWLQ